MAVLDFSSGVVVLDEDTLDAIPNGAFTIAVVFKRDAETSDSRQILICMNTGVNSGDILELNVQNDDDRPELFMNEFQQADFTNAIADDIWYLFVVKKPAGDGQTPRANLYNFNTSSWVGWANGSATVDANNTPIVELRLGNGPGSWPLEGSLAAAGIWTSALADGTVTADFHVGVQEWIDAGAVAVWRPGMTDPVTDDVGNADETSSSGVTIDSGDNPGSFDLTLGVAADPHRRAVRVAPSYAVHRAANY